METATTISAVAAKTGASVLKRRGRRPVISAVGGMREGLVSHTNAVSGEPTRRNKTVQDSGGRPGCSFRGATTAAALLAQKIKKGLHAFAGFGREFEDAHAGTHGMNVAICGLLIKFDRCRQVHLGDDRDVGAVEDGRVFQRLILAFRDREKDQTKIFAEIIGGWAHQVANIFDKQKIELTQVPTLQRVL